MRVTVEVTEDDIRLGRRFSVNSCPVARALKRLLHPKEWGYLEVLPSHFNTADDFFYLPDQVAAFIAKFDSDRKSVKPFKFRIDLPEEILK